jgi:predicted transcriptional regulator
MIVDMARVQVLVQLDDAQVDKLDTVAATVDDSRSELIRRAIDLFLAAVDESVADVRYAEAYRRAPDDPEELDALRTLAAAAWPEA